jgi:RNA polymerase sigma-70 factor (ECF subfamily)
LQSKVGKERLIPKSEIIYSPMFNKDELNKLYRYALALAEREDIAYDLLQGALEKYLKISPQLPNKPLAYIKTVIRNLFFDQHRHNKVIQMISIESEDASHIEPFDENAMDDVLIYQQDVQQLTEKLTPAENELLYLWAVEEHSAEEIATIYNQPRGTILSKLHRLKKHIKNHAQVINVAAR